MRVEQDDADGFLAVGADHGTGVLVLSGSSGRVEVERCKMLASHGLTAYSPRWFGGPGQVPGICELPLETFMTALDTVGSYADRLAVVGVSKGAEAALLTALRDPRVTAVVGLAPTSVVWANVGPGRDGEVRPQRSSWSWGGDPLPFVPYDDTAAPAGMPPEFLGVYRQSLVTGAWSVPAARIAVEEIDAEVVLVAGDDDRMWPSAEFAREIDTTRAAAGRSTTIVVGPGAGHRCVLPGEAAPRPSTVNGHGGSPEADAALGRVAWPAIATALGLG